MNNSPLSLNRRDFMKQSTGTAVTLAGLSAAPIFAAGSDTLRVGVIGCGGRGTGAATDCLASSEGVEIVALADAYEDRLTGCMDRLQKWCQENNKPFEQLVKVNQDHMFTGFNGYKRLLALNEIDLVIMAPPPMFRPVHFEAAIRAGKHVFMEKPVAVDPPGARKIMEIGRLAQQKGLAVVAGTQRRHQRDYLRTQYAVTNGAIGRVLSGRIWWCTGALWYRDRQDEWDDAEYLVRNWVSFTEMSGDHIVEQHVHNIDVANWFIGRPPRMALGFGGRARRKTGTQFDFFSVDFDYDDHVTVHSMCRQIDGTYQRVSEQFVGTEGWTWGDSGLTGKTITIPEFEEIGGPYVQEHRDLIRSIRAGTPLNEAQAVAEATLSAIMGRIAAYAGDIVVWSDLTTRTDSPWYDLRLSPRPEDFENNSATAPKEDVVAVPGKEA